MHMYAVSHSLRASSTPYVCSSYVGFQTFKVRRQHVESYETSVEKPRAGTQWKSQCWFLVVIDDDFLCRVCNRTRVVSIQENMEIAKDSIVESEKECIHGRCGWKMEYSCH